MTPVTDTQAVVNELGGSMLLAFYLPRILQWLKLQRWFPFLDDGRRHLNRITALVVAFAAAMGLHWGFSHGETGWQFIIGGPQMTLWGFALDFARQFAAQQYFYEHQTTGGPDTGLGSLRRPLTVLLAVLLPLSLIAGCGPKTPAQLPASVPLAIESTDAQLRAAAQRAVDMLSASQDLLVEVVKAEKVVEPSMSEGVKMQTRAVLHRVNASIVTAAQSIKTAAHTVRDVEATIGPVTAEVQRLVDLAGTLRSSGGFGDFAGRLLTYVKSILGGGGLPHVFEGARS